MKYWLLLDKIMNSEYIAGIALNNLLLCVNHGILYINSCFHCKGLGAIRAKIGTTSDVDKIFSKMYSQYVLFRNKYS